MPVTNSYCASNNNQYNNDNYQNNNHQNNNHQNNNHQNNDNYNNDNYNNDNYQNNHHYNNGGSDGPQNHNQNTHGNQPTPESDGNYLIKRFGTDGSITEGDLQAIANGENPKNPNGRKPTPQEQQKAQRLLDYMESGKLQTAEEGIVTTQDLKQDTANTRKEHGKTLGEYISDPDNHDMLVQEGVITQDGKLTPQGLKLLANNDSGDVPTDVQESADFFMHDKNKTVKSGMDGKAIESATGNKPK